MNETRKEGWIEAAARVLEILLQTPRFKSNLRTVLNHIDPDAAPELVRVVARADPELLLATLRTVPEGLNIGIEVAVGLAREMGRVAPPLLAMTLEHLVGRLRLRTLGEGAGRALAVAVQLQGLGSAVGKSAAAELHAGLRDGLQAESGLTPLEAAASLTLGAAETGADWLEAALERDPSAGRVIEETAARVADILARHPRFVAQVVAPLARPLAATFAMAGAGSTPAGGPAPAATGDPAPARAPGRERER